MNANLTSRTDRSRPFGVGALGIALALIMVVSQGSGARPVSAAQSSPTAVSTAAAVVSAELPVITAENVTRLKRIAQLGRGAVGRSYWSPDSQTLAVTSSIGVWLYTANQRNAPPSLLSAPSNCSNGAFSPDGTLFAAFAADGLVRVWNVRTSTLKLTADTLAPNVNFPRDVAWSPDGTLFASAGDDGTVILRGVQ